VQRVQLAAATILAPLPQQPGDEAERPGEGGLDGGVARNLAADVAEQAAQPGPQLPDVPLCLAPAADVDLSFAASRRARLATRR
jgi:hypothetical protein